MMTEIISELVTGLPMLANETNQTSSEDALVTFCSEDEGNLVVETGLGVCYLHVMDTPIDKIRMVGEGVLVVMGIYFILKVNSSHTISFIQSSINQRKCLCGRLCTSSPSLVGGFSCRTWFFVLPGSPSSSPAFLFRSTKIYFWFLDFAWKLSESSHIQYNVKSIQDKLKLRIILSSWTILLSNIVMHTKKSNTDLYTLSLVLPLWCRGCSPAGRKSGFRYGFPDWCAFKETFSSCLLECDIC